MVASVLSWLNNAGRFYQNKVCYRGYDRTATFGEVAGASDIAGTFVAERISAAQPVAVMMGREINTPVCYAGIAKAGCFYAPMDTDLPAGRMVQIMDVIRPELLITDRKSLEKTCAVVEQYRANGGETEVAVIEDILTGEADGDILAERAKHITEETPLYCIFTSGSTGVPKGVLTSHQAVCCYLDGLNKVIGIDENDVIGGQAPLDYIAAIRDMYLPFMTGCETVFLPKEEFAMPVKLFETMDRHGVTTICWSAAGVELPARLGAFDEAVPKHLKRVVFSGSVISNKLLAAWQENLPDVTFVNQYGPTEATGSCTYYVIQDKVAPETVIPIGRPFEHYEVMLLDGNGEEVHAAGEQGEICVKGPALALGYYDAPGITSRSFPQNPLNSKYPERIYRTGDIGCYREDGELLFLGRRDRQIKHMGHRVELEEVEQTADRLAGIDECASLYDHDKQLIYLFYTGEASAKEITVHFRKSVPAHMVPRRIVRLDEMPHLPNGKIAMAALKDIICGGK